MLVKCYSVRLSEMKQISPKAYLAKAFDGSEAIIPASQVFGVDTSVGKSNAWWISAWILGKKDLQYSTKKEAIFNEQGKMLPNVTITHHLPMDMLPVDNEIDELKR